MTTNFPLNNLAECRLFAAIEIGGDQYVEFFFEEELEERGGTGDELYYDEDSDQFAFAIGSGCSPMKIVANPVPGNPLEGAPIVGAQADADWEA